MSMTISAPDIGNMCEGWNNWFSKFVDHTYITQYQRKFKEEVVEVVEVVVDRAKIYLNN